MTTNSIVWWKRTAAGFLAMLMLLATAGCGRDDDPAVSDGSSEITDTTEPTGDATGDGTGSGSDPTGDPGTSADPSGSTNAPTTTPVLSGDFDIVKDGKAVATIVIGQNASDKVRTAAEDLQSYLMKMTGAAVKIGFDSVDRTNGNYILVGPSKYTDKLGIKQPTGYPNNEQVILKRVNNYLVLMGNDDQDFIGTQNAVTMFLEKQGCGWFGPDELWQVVPSVKNISVGKLDITHKPKFNSRRNNVYGNYQEIGQRWYLGGANVYLGHYLPQFVSREIYFPTHPEWFSMINGKRDPYADTWWQYCYSNKDLAAEVAKKVIEKFDSNPSVMTIPVTANDGWELFWCECPECNKYPSDTDLMIEFANRVARDVAKKYPDKRVSILSYHSTWHAPQTSIQAEPNVEIMFCRETSMTSPIENGLYLGDNRDGITHNTYKSSWKDNFLSYINKAKVKHVSIWEWYCVAAERESWKDIPWVQGDVAIRNQNFWKANGAEYIFYDQGPLANYRETGASFPLRWPLWYVAAKGMWDDSLSGDQILLDACNKLYGSAGKEMYSYYKALANASETCTAYSMTWIPPEPAAMYNTAQIGKIDVALNSAKAKLNSVTADQKKRMENQISLWEKAKKLI